LEAGEMYPAGYREVLAGIQLENPEKVSEPDGFG